MVDGETGRGVPLVELRTTGGLVHVTDSGGLVAFEEPGLMGQTVFFHVKSHGYEFAADGFGFRGARLTPVAGGRAVLEIRRRNVAERLYRVTGAGIYRDSVILGKPVPVREPLLNGGVLGQDSVLCIPYRDRLYWFWGDTNRAAYPLGNFAASGATSRLDADPGAGIDLAYFVDDAGFSRPMCAVEGPGPKWLDGLMRLPDGEGRERLVAHYARMKTLGEMHEHGLVLYDDAAEVFRPLARFDLGQALYPHGHPVRVESGGKAWVLFGAPFPRVRVPADLAAVRDPAAYEAFVDGAWRRGAPPAKPAPLRDAATGRPVTPHHGCVAWNAHRARWIAVFTEAGGETSYLGEIWYAEADTAVGPWVYARHVVSHDQYSFYNPKLHPWFDREGGRVVHFEGTYTLAFSATKEPTPRYDYNQVMYRLDLDDPRLAVPAPVYRLDDGALAAKADVERRGAWERVRAIAFFAPDRPGAGLVAREGGFHVLAEAHPSPDVVETEAGRAWSAPEGPLAREPAARPLGP